MSRTDATLTRLRRADHHLGLAGDLLSRPLPEYRAAAVHVNATVREALAALVAWNGPGVLPAEDLAALSRRAVAFASILRTPVSRALASRPELRRVGSAATLTVHDREAVETAWFTARNLYHTVRRELPSTIRAAVHPRYAAGASPDAQPLTPAGGDGASGDLPLATVSPAVPRRFVDRAFAPTAA